MGPDGPIFHQLVETDEGTLKNKIKEMPGELVMRKQIPVHVVGDMSVATADSVDRSVILKGIEDAIAVIKKHRGSYMSHTEAEDIFKPLRTIRSEAQK